MKRRSLLATTAWAAIATMSRMGESRAGAATDAAQLMQQVQQQASSNDEVVQISMKLTDADGKTAQRQAVFYRKQSQPGILADMKLIRFSSPAELNGSAVLIHENTDRADDQWLYLPAYRTSRKVPSSNRSDRYMGTDFFYEDVSSDKIEQYEYRVTGQEKFEGRSCVVIEQTPRDDEVKRESGYGRKLQWVDPERLLVSRIDYFDAQGTLIKRLEAGDPSQIGGRWRWGRMVMTDLRMKHATEIQYADRKIDIALDTAQFSVRSLERSR